MNYLHFCYQCDSTVIYIQRIKIIHLWGDHYSQVYVIKSILKTKGLFDVIDYVTTVMTIPVKVKERYLIKKLYQIKITIKFFDIFRLYLSCSVQFSSLSTVSCTAYHYNKYKQYIHVKVGY